MELKLVSNTDHAKQLSTFRVAGRLFGIDVTQVQEIVKPMPMTRIPLAPSFVCGLINLRGQVATAVGLRELFHLARNDENEQMNVVCRSDNSLISLLVDDIGDVIEVYAKDYESTPRTVPEQIARHMAGVYKLKNELLSVLDVDCLFEDVNQVNSAS